MKSIKNPITLKSRWLDIIPAAPDTAILIKLFHDLVSSSYKKQQRNILHNINKWSSKMSIIINVQICKFIF